jgi:chemotaxis protein CheC
MIDAHGQDVLNEVINIGFGEAADALSELIDSKVLLSVPELAILDLKELSAFVQRQISEWGVYIAQDFDGQINGRTLLVYSEEGSLDLVTALLGEELRTVRLTEVAKATLQELGNIILGSCMSVFGDLLDARLRYTIPQVSVECSTDYFTHLIAESAELGRVIAVKSTLEVSDRQIEGLVVVVLSFTDFETIVKRAKEQWTP